MRASGRWTCNGTSLCRCPLRLQPIIARRRTESCRPSVETDVQWHLPLDSPGADSTLSATRSWCTIPYFVGSWFVSPLSRHRLLLFHSLEHRLQAILLPPVGFPLTLGRRTLTRVNDELTGDPGDVGEVSARHVLLEPILSPPSPCFRSDSSSPRKGHRSSHRSLNGAVAASSPAMALSANAADTPVRTHTSAKLAVPASSLPSLVHTSPSQPVFFPTDKGKGRAVRTIVPPTQR